VALAPGNFPGGKVQAVESRQGALRRELKQEMGVDALPQLFSHKNKLCCGQTLNA